MTATLRDPLRGSLGDQATMLRQRDEASDDTGTVAGSSLALLDVQSVAGPDGQRDGRGGGTRGGGLPPARFTRTASAGGEPGTTRRAGPSFAAACVDMLPALPTICAITTVFAYIGVGDMAGVSPVVQLWPLVLGGVSAVSLGLAMAACHRPFFTAPDQAHPRSFAELRQRLDSLSSQLRILNRRADDDLTASQQLALGDAAAHQRALERELSRGGPHWIIGTGYVDAMTRLHRAEEALILVQPTEEVVAGALFDEVRLDGSTIPERERLLARLRAALQMLGSQAAPYLGQSVPSMPDVTPADPQAAPLLPVSSLPEPSFSGGPLQATPVSRTAESDPALQARLMLQGIRRTINEFRDESRARLTRSRCRLIGTMTVTGIITYVLLAFAVTVSPTGRDFAADPVTSATAIYLVGAVVGLFNRLYTESGDESAMEDYGLSRTRLLLTPMLSGLAAVGGVMIVGMLSGMVDVTAFTPVASVTPTPVPGVDGTSVAELIQGRAAREAILGLADIFSLEQYPFGLVLASIFGLMPKRFLERLQRASEQTRLDLQSTAATRQ